ncbi:MAG: DUF386 domain-containing protein [Bacteroidetes bacterium]|nr:MAG: DUF386 domain-containing protein [Bacteroidota bacterium]
MIYDRIDNWRTYFKGPVFEEVFQTLKDYNQNTANGIYRYDDKGFYFKVMEYDTKEEADIIETHRKEVDIQILLAGHELIKMYGTEDVKTKKPYDEESDCEFYDVNNDPYCELILKPEYMAVFFPEDPHHPQFQIGNGPEHLKKIVIKVNIDLFR